MKNLLFYVGFRHLQAKPVRTILTTLGVSFGIALFVAISLINHSTLDYFRESIDAVAGKAKLSITSGESGFPESKLEIVEKTPGVKYAVPMLENRAYLARTDESLLVLGVDLLKEQSVRTYKTTDRQVIDDPLTFLNQPDSIILTQSFANQHELKIDSKFDLATSQGQKTFTVRGILTDEGPAKAYGGAIAIMDIDGAEFTFGKQNKLDRIDIVPNEEQDIDQLATALRTRLGDGYHVERPESQAESTERMVKSFQLMLGFFSTLALFVGLFLVTNSVGISVAERKREIGTLRALGASKKGILGLFLSDAMLMGLLGSILGVGLGRALASVMLKLVNQSMSAQYELNVKVATVHINAHEIWKAVLVGTFASTLAAAWPAFKATRIHPLEAMKRQDIDSSGKAAGFFKYSPYIGLTMIILLTISYSYNLITVFPAIEIVNQMLMVFGPAFAGPYFVNLLIKLFRPIIVPLGGTISKLAEENLLKNPKRTGSNVMSLMVGLILVILISSVDTSFRTTLVNWFNKIRRGDLLVSSAGNAVTFDVQPLDEKLGYELATVPGVDGGIFHSAYAIRFVHLDYQGQRLGMKAYDDPGNSVGYDGFDVQDRSPEVAGRELFSSPDPTVIVSDNFVLHFHKKTGDHISIDTPSGKLDLRIIAVVADFANPAGVFYIPRALFKKYWKDSLVTFFGVKVLPGVDPNRVLKDIDERFAKKRNLMVVSNAEFLNQMNHVLDDSFAYTRAIEAAALLVGLLGLLNTLLVSVMERTRELGMLRALGMDKKQLARMILEEALIQGSLGAVAAVILGSWLAYLWIGHSLAFILGWIVHYYFPWKSVIFTVFLGVAVALIAGIYPSRKAANLEITEALDYE